MNPQAAGQRNPYKGTPPRPWVRVRLIAIDGSIVELDVLADTGNPCALIVGEGLMAAFNHGDLPGLHTNFGALTGGLLWVSMPEVGINEMIEGFAGDAAVASAQESSPDFMGLAGLPLLRLAEYGGDANWFWFRPP